MLLIHLLTNTLLQPNWQFDQANLPTNEQTHYLNIMANMLYSLSPHQAIISIEWLQRVQNQKVLKISIGNFSVWDDYRALGNLTFDSSYITRWALPAGTEFSNGQWGTDGPKSMIIRMAEHKP